ncbi:MAG TPA: hypothetical protein VFG54_20895 [Prolixibacteraceae bacterium]|nr:hypothetical protein [Prolixibacteraceae bacterium]
MGIFNFFRPKQDQFNTPVRQDASLVPRDSYSEDQGFRESITAPAVNGKANDIEAVYAFLQADYESRGYNDALVNADNSNKNDGIKLITLDLQLLTRRVINYYDKKIKDLEVQIGSRSRAGLLDLVEELRSEKEKAERDLEEVKQMNAEIDTGTGMVERIILSYQKGFMRGLSAITQSRMTK